MCPRPAPRRIIILDAGYGRRGYWLVGVCSVVAAPSHRPVNWRNSRTCGLVIVLEAIDSNRRRCRESNNERSSKRSSQELLIFSSCYFAENGKLIEKNKNVVRSTSR